MIETIEIGAALLGMYLLFREVFIQRFANFITSIFLLCYVPLFCVYPVIAKLAVGGAISINTNVNGVLGDLNVYIVYQLANFGILVMCFLLQQMGSRRHAPYSSPKPPNVAAYEVPFLVLMLCAGVLVYIQSTGLTVAELLVASRFEWFQNDDYSSIYSVVASYLIALAPVVIYLLAKEKKRYLLLLVLVIGMLVFYGVLSKDRKWVIFIASGLLAAIYVSSGRRLIIKAKGVIALTIFALVLAFWQIARGVIFSALITGGGDVVSDAKELAIRLLTEGDFPYYYNASMTAIQMNVNEDYSIPFGLVSRQLLFFLPVDYSLGLKIEDISALFSDAIMAGDEIRRGNMPPGFFGLFVLSFGWFGGIILLSLFPILLKMLDNVVRKNSGISQIVIVSHALSTVLLLLRGDDSSATYFIIFSIIVLYLLRLPRAIAAYARRSSRPTFA